MQYFVFLVSVLIMVSFYDSVEGKSIPCNVEALEWNDMLRDSLYRNVFWTKKFLDDNEYIGDKERPILRNFLQDDDKHLVRTIFGNNNGSPTSRGYSVEITNPNNILFFDYQLIVDEEKAIFQYIRGNSEVGKIKWNTAFEQYNQVEYTYHDVITENAFAIIYEERNALFRIYRSCDGKGSWVQVEDKVLKQIRSQRRKRKARDDGRISYTSPSGHVSHYPDTFIDLNQMIQDALNELEIPGIEYDLENEMSFDKFFEEFDRIDLAAMFQERST